MNKEQQIKAIHKIMLNKSFEWWELCPMGKAKSEYVAEALYNAGYRKQSEVAKDIFKRH